MRSIQDIKPSEEQRSDEIGMRKDSASGVSALHNSVSEDVTRELEFMRRERTLMEKEMQLLERERESNAEKNVSR